MPQTVLVVTEQFDVTADHVVLALEERKIPVFRFDTAEFPQALTLSARLDRNQSGTLRTPTREISFDEVSGVYWRRPSIYQLSPALNADDAAWTAREARFGMGGVLAAMPVWLNHPAHIARTETSQSSSPPHERPALLCRQHSSPMTFTRCASLPMRSVLLSTSLSRECITSTPQGATSSTLNESILNAWRQNQSALRRVFSSNG